uniref:Chitin-binding type-1 domain-containing protein n=1 Tax=Branchiostoma floridae TaxID=7739 RepID=C3Z814_BRAFL|eukprot:XP_002595316.1 hypothetical protein BRAFLDRAFT_87552 [Branchiostoma floridae]
MEPYAVRYLDKNADDDNGVSQEREAACTFCDDAGTSGNDAGTSVNDAGTSGNDAGTSGNDAGTSGNDIGTSGKDTGTTPMQQTDWQARADGAASTPHPLYDSGADRTYPGGASGRRARCRSIRSQLIYIATAIAALLSLVAIVLALLAITNNREISELTPSVDALYRNQGNMSTAVNALKRVQDDMRQLSTTVDALKRDQDHMRQLFTTFDALKPDQDDMPTTVEALKLDQDKEQIRTAALEQRLHELTKSPAPKKWREDGRCGQWFPAEDGNPAECYPEGDYTCCSEFTWCGKTAAHCDCPACVDYRNTGSNTHSESWSSVNNTFNDSIPSFNPT